MRKPALAVVLASLLAASVGQARADAELQQYNVPSGSSTLVFSTALPSGTALQSIQFIAGGNPDIRIVNITADDGSSSFTFNPPARPSEVTQFFAQNPIGPTSSNDWHVDVDNTGSSTLRLNFGARFELAP